ncbi:hypothetical protein ACYZTX_00530 [Pseudomonas sp. MDT1-17]
MERFLKDPIILGHICLLAACTDIDSPLNQRVDHPLDSTGLNESQAHPISVKRVVTGVNTAGQPTISILVGSSHRNMFDSTLLRLHIQGGYSVPSLSYRHPEIELMARRNGNLFTQSTDVSTTVTLTIHSLTPRHSQLLRTAGEHGNG